MFGSLAGRSIIGGLTGLILSHAGGAVLAQSLPPAVDPGRIDERFEAPLAPESVPALELPAPSQAPPPEQADQIRFTLEDIAFDGNTALGDDQLRPLYRDLLGNEVSLKQLYDLRDAVTARYRQAGYVLSQAVIPAQRIADGQVRITIIEGFVDRVAFEGDTVTDRRDLLADMAAKITAARPLTQRVLERYLLLMNDLPGVRARTVLRPAEGVTGGAVLAVIFEEQPIDARLSVDNRGSDAIGPFQLDATAAANNPLGLFDRLRVRGILASETEELRYLDLRESAVLNAEGTTLGLRGRVSLSEPGADVERFDIESFNGTVTLDLSHPVIRSRSETLRANASFTYRHSRTDAAGSLLTLDKLRVLEIGGVYDFADRFQGRSIFELDLVQGLDIFGASNEGSTSLTRRGGQVDFTKLTFAARRDQPLSAHFGLVAAVEGQYSPDELLSSEEFGIGGSSFGRAYDSSEITGDTGIAGRLEAQAHWSGGDLAGLVDGEPDAFGWLDRAQLYLFADGGAVRNYEAGTRQGWQDLASVGAGVRLAVLERFSADLQLAKPVTRDAGATGDKGVRLFFSVVGRY